MQIALTYIYRIMPYIFLANTVYIPLRFWYAKSKEYSFHFWYEAIRLVVVNYFTFVVVITMVPDWKIVRDYATNRVIFFSGIAEDKSLNLLPFQTIVAFLRGYTNVNPDESNTVIFLNVVGNILLLTPLSFCMPIVNHKFTKPYTLIGSGLVFSFGVEIVQFFIGRSADIDDLILNTLGVIIGYLGFRLAFRVKYLVFHNRRCKLRR